MRRIVRPTSGLLAAAIITAFASQAAIAVVPAQTQSQAAVTHGRHYDARLLLTATAKRGPGAAQQSALDAMRAKVTALRYDIDAATGATRTLSNMVGHLTDPTPGEARAIALDFVRNSAALLGLSDADLAGHEITDEVKSPASPVRHVYLRQKHAGLPVYQGQLQVHVNDDDGRILMVNNRFLPNLAEAVNRWVPSIEPEAALAAAAANLGRSAGPIVRISTMKDAQRSTVLEAPMLSTQKLDARLMLLPVGTQARLVWNFQVWEPNDGDIADFTVDAETGEVWTRSSWVDEATYKVFALPAESPIHTTPAAPDDGRITLIDPHNFASPFGWHDTDGAAGAEYTITQGNNTHAYTDLDNDNEPDADSSPDCTAALECIFPLDLMQAANTYRPAAAANLFYMSNMMHDVAYPFGFDEVSGNFQANNYGNGGLEGDDVLAEAQDGGGINNANFATPPDGSPPRMQMYLWNHASPSRDSDFDNGIIAHEYGHGISNRLVGGPSNSGCLTNNQQPGEGLSDWWALYTTQPDATTRRRSIGTYSMGQPTDGVGLRSSHYDPDPAGNLWTYQSIRGGGNSHAIGEKWAQAYWQVTWALIDEYGYEPNIDHFTGTAADKGNTRAMFYIVEGLKNTACGPSFLDARDGVIAAANAAPFEGVDTCRIWKQFAEFGLGVDATGSANTSSSATNGFLEPDYCHYLFATPTKRAVCAGDDAVYPLTLGPDFVPPVSLSASGVPAGATQTITINPVTTAPGESKLTIGNTAAAPGGRYEVIVSGAHGGEGSPHSLVLKLDLFQGVPTAPVLTMPADDAIVSVLPTLTWADMPGIQHYTVEVATDAAFTDIVFVRIVNDGVTSIRVTDELATQTRYYWRVRGDNTCGIGSDSAVNSFTTVPPPGQCFAGQNLRPLYSHDVENGTPGWSTEGSTGRQTWAVSTARPNSGSKSWLAVDFPVESDQRLMSPPIALPANGVPMSLSFMSDITIEEVDNDPALCWDGAFLEVSGDNGETWKPIGGGQLSTPYTGPIRGSSQNVWCGVIPYRETRADLTDYAGQTVRMRLRVLTDAAVGREPHGWYVDDVKVQSCDAGFIFANDFED